MQACPFRKSRVTALCYVLTVLIWGTTWIAIKGQLGSVPVEASIAYRFALAGIVLWLFLRLTGKLRAIPWSQQPYILLQALCLFSCNFLLIYAASAHVTSGIVSVVFSAATVFNIANGYVFQRRRPSGRVLAGACLGVLGILGLFWDTVTSTTLNEATTLGLGLALAGTWFFSLGNLVSARNTSRGLPVASVIATAMLYGALIVALFAWVRGVPFSFDPSTTYVGSLLYLAIPGSVIGFTTYLTVVHRLGPDRAAYMTVLFPVVALTLSYFFEGYRLTTPAALGLAGILLGNVLVLVKPGQAITQPKGAQP